MKKYSRTYRTLSMHAAQLTWYGVLHGPLVKVKLFVLICVYITETSCDNGIVHNSTCYKIYRDPVNWFTAVNRCLDKNGTLAVFDDHILTYFTATLLIEGPLWIGLIKSWLTWPDAGTHVF